MQDAKKIREQVDEMTLRAEVKATVTQEHRQILVQRKTEIERELTKMKLLHEMFGISQRLLEQRAVQLQQAEQVPSAAVLEGLTAAKIELGRLEGQAKEAVMRHDGAFMALNAMDESLRQEEMQATSRARGLPVQGERLVQMAQSASGEIETPEAPQESPQPSSTSPKPPSFLDSLEEVDDDEEEVLAKEPMDAPQQTAPKKRSRRKA